MSTSGSYIRIRLSPEELDYLLENLPTPTTRAGFAVMAKLLPADEVLAPAKVSKKVSHG